MQSNNYSAYVALGQQRVLVLILTAHLIVVLPLMIFLGGKFGILGVAYAELTASAASLAVGYPVLFKTLKISVRNYCKKIWHPLLAAMAMGFTVRALIREATAMAFAPVLQLALYRGTPRMFCRTVGKFQILQHQNTGAREETR